MLTIVICKKYFILQNHLGGGDSLVEHAATMIHALMNEKSRKRVGITDDLIILSIGLEDVNDLIGDLDRGLD